MLDKIRKILKKLLKSVKKRSSFSDKFGHKNKKYKFVHLMHNDKFNADYIGFINENFSPKDHLFIFYGGWSQFKIPDLENVLFCKSFKQFKKNKKCLESAKKIILHGLFQKKVVLFLDRNSDLLTKCSWVIWGGDLYHYKYRDKNPKEDLFEEVRKRVIGAIGEFTTVMKEDYDLARSWYGAKGSFIRCVIYPNALCHYDSVDIVNIKKTSPNILVGNSAAAENNHIEIFHRLQRHLDKISKVICPLSYCDKNGYAQKVIEEGRKIFQDKFLPITDFMDKEQYYNMLLNDVDIAIFNHERQQALGNIISLFAMGKKVYVSQKSCLYEGLKFYNLRYFASEDIESDSFFEIVQSDAVSNIKSIRSQFSFEVSKEQWGRILS
ncbi:MAG: hypothetical protein ACJAZX_000292 [Rickettsiales bacterium]|jgi:hypothetical protein